MSLDMLNRKPSEIILQDENLPSQNFQLNNYSSYNVENDFSAYESQRELNAVELRMNLRDLSVFVIVLGRSWRRDLIMIMRVEWSEGIYVSNFCRKGDYDVASNSYGNLSMCREYDLQGGAYHQDLGEHTPAPSFRFFWNEHHDEVEKRNPKIFVSSTFL